MNVVNHGMPCGYLEAPSTTLWDWEGRSWESSAASRLRIFRDEALASIRAGSAALDLLLEDGSAEGASAGVMGISLGGILATRLAQEDPRVKSLVLLLSAAGLSDILAGTQWPPLRDYMEALSRETGLRGDHLREFLDAELAPVDPIAHTHRMRGLPVFVMSPQVDPLLPRPAVDRFLWQMNQAGALVEFLEVNSSVHNPLYSLFTLASNLGGLIHNIGGIQSSQVFLDKTLR